MIHCSDRSRNWDRAGTPPHIGRRACTGRDLLAAETLQFVHRVNGHFVLVRVAHAFTVDAMRAFNWAVGTPACAVNVTAVFADASGLII